MNAPTPQTKPNPARARGVLLEKTPETIVFNKPGTDYRLHLTTLSPINAEPGDRVVGTIRIKAAKRFDVVRTGGRYIEPLYGQPRHIQGDVVAIDASNNTITVNAVMPFVVTLAPTQQASDFEVGQFVGGNVRSDAAFSVSHAN
jgi:hypothetical protein